MGDPNWRYGAFSDTGSFPQQHIPGYFSWETSKLPTPNAWSSNTLQGSSSDYLQKDIIPLQPSGYGIDNYMGHGVHPEPVLGKFTVGESSRSYSPPLEDANLLNRRLDVGPNTTPGIPDVSNERPGSCRKADTFPLPASESNILFVDGLPKDCSRREVGHIFRPFIGFKDIRVIHKEPRHTGDKAMVLCFVEFVDAKCALTALEALQGYKFDDKKPDSPTLRIHFAHFPFCLPSEH